MTEFKKNHQPKDTMNGLKVALREML